jgi:hypothetical protein
VKEVATDVDFAFALAMFNLHKNERLIPTTPNVSLMIIYSGLKRVK